MTAPGQDLAVTVGAAPAVTHVFHVGDIVAATADLALEEGGYLFGEVIPAPTSFTETGHTLDEWAAALADPTIVWVQFRRVVRYPQPVPASDLHPVDTDRVIALTLHLLAQAGISVTRHEVGIGDEAAALICDDDEPGEHAHHARSLTLWFEAMDDVMALTELTYRGPVEFGCDWPSVYAPDGFRYGDARGRVKEGAVIRAIHLADLPTLADLAAREIRGELGGSPAEMRLRRRRTVTIRLALLGLASEAVRVVLFGRSLGLLGVLVLLLAAIPLVRAARRWRREGRVPPRGHLDAARRRTGKADQS